MVYKGVKYGRNRILVRIQAMKVRMKEWRDMGKYDENMKNYFFPWRPNLPPRGFIRQICQNMTHIFVLNPPFHLPKVIFQIQMSKWDDPGGTQILAIKFFHWRSYKIPPYGRGGIGGEIREGGKESSDSCDFTNMKENLNFFWEYILFGTNCQGQGDFSPGGPHGGTSRE